MRIWSITHESTREDDKKNIQNLVNCSGGTGSGWKFRGLKGSSHFPQFGRQNTSKMRGIKKKKPDFVEIQF